MEKKRILIVDDDPNLSRLSGIILESSGLYEVKIVNQALTALKIAAEFRADLLLLDVDMPDMDGGDLARRAAQDPRLSSIPVLFLTGLVRREEAGTRPIESGGMRFLAKPVEPAVLLTAVAELISSPIAA